jgi:hypothetical protein
MKLLTIILLTFISSNAISQSSYQEHKSVAEVAFDITFEVPEKNGVTQKYVLSAKEDFEITTQNGPFKTLSTLLEKAFRLADCDNCEKVSEEIMIDPITYIFRNIEYQDVYFVEKHKKGFKVIRYQPKEKD